MRWLPLALVLASTPASAEEKLVRATGRLDGKTARLTARYTIPVAGGITSASDANLALPRGAIVTGARATLGGVTHPLTLLDAADARTRHAALSGDEVKPGAKTSAVMIETAPGGVHLSIMTPRIGTLVVDLELSAPTCFHREIRYVAVPKGWSSVAGAVPTKRRAERQMVDDVCGSLGEDFAHWVGFAAGDVARLGDRIEVTGDRIDVGADSIVRVEVNLANILAEVPRDLATVLVVDGSRSMSDEQLEAQRDTVRAYLKSAPDSRVQVIAFARHARPLLSSWMAARAARASVDAALQKLVLENGSNFDAGLGEASNWLARIKGTKRVVLITDQLLAKRLQQQPATALEQRVPPGTLVHVVVATNVPGQLYRDDKAKLAGLAEATEGMLVRGGPDDGDRPVDATRLVRPIELEYMTLSTPGWTQIPNDAGEPLCETDATLAQGRACMWWGQSKRDAAKPITIGGRLWNKKIAHVVFPSVARAIDFARELSWHGGLSKNQRKQLDETARGVNDKWSLYVAWGGPGTYEVTGGGTGWGAVCGCGSPGTIGHGSGTGTYTTTTNRVQVPLEKQLADKLATCRLGTERVAVEVELTVQEIADVHVKAKTAQGAEKDRIERCVAEVVWASAPTIVKPHDHQIMTFVAGG